MAAAGTPSAARKRRRSSCGNCMMVGLLCLVVAGWAIAVISTVKESR